MAQNFWRFFCRVLPALMACFLAAGASAQMPFPDENLPVRRALPVKERTAQPFRTTPPVPRPEPPTPPVLRPEPPTPPIPRPAPPTPPAVPFDTGVPVPPPVPSRAPPAPHPSPAAVPAEPTPESIVVPEPEATRAQSMAETQLQIANGLFARKLYDLAVPEYERYLGQYFDAENRPMALFRLGECYRSLGNRVAAKNAYQSLLLNFTDGEFVGPASYRLADLYYQDENYSSALALFERAADKSKGEAVVTASRFYAARTLERMHRNSEARRRYESVIAAKGVNPYRDAARLSLAKLLLDAGRNDAAVEQFEALSREAVKPEMRAEAKVRSALMKIDLKKLDEAAADLKQALAMPALGKWEEVAQLGLLRILLERGKYKEVLDTYAAQKETLSEEAKPEVLLMAANAHRQLNEFKEAREMYETLITAYPSSAYADDARYNLLVSLYSARDPGLSAAVDQFVAENPKSGRKAQAQLLKAEALFRERKYAEAAPAYESIDRDELPKEIQSDELFKLGWSLVESGNNMLATKIFTEFLTKYPTSKLAPSALCQRALARQRSKDFTGALEDFNRLLIDYPKAKERELALQQKALILGQQQENQAMTETFGQLLKEFPNTPAAAQANYWIGWAAFEAKAYRKAIEALDKARQLDKEEFFERASLRILLAHFYLEDRTAVARELDKFAAEKATNKVPAEILRWLGGEYLTSKNYEGAATYLGQLVEREQERTPSDWLNLGRAQIELGKCEEAKKAIETYLQTAAQPVPRATGFLALAAAELGLRDGAAAQKAAEQAMQLQPEGRLNAQGRMITGDVAMAGGRYEDAAKTYLGLSVVFEDPVITPEALHKAYTAYGKAGETEKAAKVLNELQTRFPEYSQAAGLAR